jgi:hypothetical protein
MIEQHKIRVVSLHGSGNLFQFAATDEGVWRRMTPTASQVGHRLRPCGYRQFFEFGGVLPIAFRVEL